MYKGKENLVYPHLADLVTIAEWKYPFPSRTRKSSTLAPMILLYCGKVGSRQVFFLFSGTLCGRLRRHCARGMQKALPLAYSSHPPRLPYRKIDSRLFCRCARAVPVVLSLACDFTYVG